MKYNIISNRTLTRRQKKRSFLKWTIYAAVLLFLYCLMCSSYFSSWQPVLIIPFALAVSMYEREFQATVFSAICGLFVDMACGYLFGFSSVWLMICCLTTSLLVMNLIKLNLVNYVIICAATTVIYSFMNFMFNYFLWFDTGKDVIFFNYILPPAIAQVIMSPIFYFLVRLISSKLGDERKRTAGDAPESASEDEE